MEELPAVENKITLQKLDRFLLYYVGGEIGYAAILLAIEIILIPLSLVSDGAIDPFMWIDEQEFAIFGMLIPYSLAYLGNLVIGLWGIVLYIREQREGNPGFGHLLNWGFVISLLWVVLVLVAVVLPEFIQYGF